MPAYLCHGFRWHRRSVRVYVVVQNLDDASPEWIIPAKSAACILESFYNLFDFLPYCSPAERGINSRGSSEDGNLTQNTSRAQSRGHRSRSQSQSQSHRSRSRQPSQQRQMSDGGRGGTSGADFFAQDWSVVKVLEEYDPMNLDEVSRPYAYVADYVVPVDLSVSIAEEMQKYEERVKADRDPPIMGPGSDETGRKKGNKQRTGWFEKLRDQLQRGEEIRWYVVVNGDEVRDFPEYPQERPTPTQQQQTHHAQYMLQQQIFEGKDRGRRRDAPGAPQPTRVVEQKPRVPEKDLPPIQSRSPVPQSKMSLDSHELRPKTPKRGGLRRLFGRGKGEDPVSP
ncbi:hypothetical protein QBC34DRAFT_61764 [Podospora aff. communis PSN243]|uniref:Developmental regulator n=1 Tax=Podospora aff. communis PSN243 TaxID=3040156 RepID=A0AAV9GRF8_9PEZI|nr:hypothetical protein QBC34DRAFT_61764 [Podospora aff. communis PSN243]